MAAQAQYDNEMTGVLFPVKEKKNEKGPDITGTATIGGTEYRMAGWRKSTKSDGSPFYSIKFEIPDATQAKSGGKDGKAGKAAKPSADDEPF